MQRGGFQMHFQYDTNLVWCCVSQHFFMLYCTNSSSCSLWFFDVFSSYSLVINYLCNDLVCILFFCSAVDIISAIEFDKSGDHLATGDRGGRVVLFERTDNKDVLFLFSFARLTSIVFHKKCFAL